MISTSKRINVLSFDIEDWTYLVMRRYAPPAQRRPEEVIEQTGRILSLLGEHGVEATFFVLGSTAASAPGLVQRIISGGHEVACHGQGHQPVGEDLQAWREDIRTAKDELEQQSGHAVRGYRAPAFSVPPDRVDEFFDILGELGLQYDSSIVPVGMSRYGIAGFQRAPHVVNTSTGRQIVEFPLSVVYWLGRPWMIAGGGYWRLFPLYLLQHAVKRLGAQGLPLVTYFHNYEFSTRPLKIRDVPSRSQALRRWELRSNAGLASVYRKLDRLLLKFSFTSFRNVLADYLNAPREAVEGKET